jgi:DNA-directed RNA polymerase specialized sigma24 family protein
MQIVGSLPARQKWLWCRIEVDGARIVDLQKETGRNANSLHAEIHAIRKKLRRATEGHRALGYTPSAQQKTRSSKVTRSSKK